MHLRLVGGRQDLDTHLTKYLLRGESRFFESMCQRLRIRAVPAADLIDRLAAWRR
jgi:hypothetical protein